MYERRTARPISRRHFVLRMVRHGAVALSIVGVSLGIGMWGYGYYEGLRWRDSFLNAAMLLGGMGPVNDPVTDGGKVFAGLYALYAGLVFIVTAGLLLAPVVHRVLHRFHWETGK
jgi:hypothetical protein